MPIIQKLVSFDDMFYNLSESPIFVNELSINTDEERQQVEELIVSRYTTDYISLLPSCRCGYTKGKFYIGTKCKVCLNKVTAVIDDNIQPIVWFKRSEGVGKIINIMILMMLKDRFRASGFDTIQWLIDTKYKTNFKLPKVVQKLIDANLPRGYNNFVNNFDSIMDFLFNLKDFNPPKRQFTHLYDLIKRERDIIFSDYLPLPNKSLLIIEDTNIRTYVDLNILKAKDAIQMLVSMDKDVYDQNPKFKENRLVKALNELCEFYYIFLKENVGKDIGQLRKHVFGTKTNFTFRAVMTSITEPHHYQDLHIPWSIGLTTFEPYLIKKLLRIGFTLNNARSLILSKIEVYDELLHDLLNQIINETPDQAIPLLLLRNPTLLPGSIQKVRGVIVKTNPKDKTISSSILTVRAFNLDFDGKQSCCL